MMLKENPKVALANEVGVVPPALPSLHKTTNEKRDDEVYKSGKR